jgi:hypothetical protein
MSPGLIVLAATRRGREIPGTLRCLRTKLLAPGTHPCLPGGLGAFSAKSSSLNYP